MMKVRSPGPGGRGRMLRYTLLLLSKQDWLRRRAETSPFSRKFTQRFVAGTTLEAALESCRRLNAAGLHATLACLGENVRSLDEVSEAHDAYLEAIEGISAERLKATISVKLTQLGLDISDRVCWNNVTSLAEAARQGGVGVEVDMESSRYVDETLRIARDVHASCGCVRVAVQAYLRRSHADVETLSAFGVPVRVCKGAYAEPAHIALPNKREVTRNYLRLVNLLFQSGVHVAVATHDERLIEQVIRIVRRLGLAREEFEFQMLYGIRRDLQLRLSREGFRVRVYVPYGKAWYPYLVRRLAERPANALFLLKNVLRAP